MPVLDSLGLFHNSCCALFSVSEIDRGTEKWRGAEKLEIVNRQLSSFILVDGSIYLLPGLFVTVSVCAGRRHDICIIYQPLDGNNNRGKVGRRKELFFSCKRQKKKETKSWNGCVLTGTWKVAMSRNYFSSGIEPTRNDHRDKDNGDLVRVMSRR